MVESSVGAEEEVVNLLLVINDVYVCYEKSNVVNPTLNPLAVAYIYEKRSSECKEEVVKSQVISSTVHLYSLTPPLEPSSSLSPARPTTPTPQPP